MIKILFTVSLLICITAQAQKAVINDTTIIDKIITSYADNHIFSGVVMIANKGKVVYSKGYGFAQYENRVHNSEKTRFNIASISKSFTAAAILKLHETNKLKLDDKVSKIFPLLPHTDSITIINLLKHSSGIPDIIRFPDFDVISKKNYGNTEQVLPIFLNKPLLFVPGKRQSYSNSNYILLAAIIEKVSRQSYSDFLEQNFFLELGMKETSVFTSRLIMPNRASGYSVTGASDYFPSDFVNYSIVIGASSIFTTANDLIRWTSIFKSTNLLSSTSLSLLNGTNGEAIAWRVDTLQSHLRLSANGWDGYGFSANISYFIDSDISIAVLGNLNISNSTEKIQAAIAEYIFTGITSVFSPINLPALSLPQYIGTYQLGNDFYVSNLKLEFIVENDYVQELQSNGNIVALLPLGTDIFMHRSSGAYIKFKRNNDGIVDGLNFFGQFDAKKID